MKLRCFVAMAFSHPDTDRVFDRLIVPTLHKLHITPIRVDRIEHNDDIDNRIIYELEHCNVALADLTYARPSVYFEAGFAQRQVPVIYTCRRDHFKPREDDEAGNYRVHFDLQMKNIIAWESASDGKFAERLGKRIKKVVAPILHQREAEQRLAESSREFATLSVEEKTDRVSRLCVEQLEQQGYRQVSYDTLAWRSYSDRLASNIVGYLDRERYGELTTNSWLGIRSYNHTIESAFSIVTQSLTKNQLTAIYRFLLRQPTYRINPRGLKGDPSRLIEHLYIYSFRKVSLSTIMETLPNYHRLPDSKDLQWSGTQLIATGNIRSLGALYVRNGSLGDFVIISKRREIEFYSNERNIYEGKSHRVISLGGKKTKDIPVGRTLEIPRTIHIHILDSTVSEEQVKEQMHLSLKIDHPPRK